MQKQRATPSSSSSRASIPAPSGIAVALGNWQFWTIVILRSIFLWIGVATLAEFVDLGTPTSALTLAVVLGTVSISVVAFSRLTQIGFLLGSLLAYLLFEVIVGAAGAIISSTSERIFRSYTFALHGDLFLAAFAVGGVSAWLFWRYRHWITLEVIALASIALFVISGHRNYRFDRPQIVNTIAWQLGTNELTVLVGLGAVLSVATLLYLLLATIPGRPQPGTVKSAAVSRSQRTVLASAGVAVVVFGVIAVVSRQVYSYNIVVAQGRVSEGVGEAAQGGMSPLGFHSALGATNQPSAVVRLEGDYRDNPFTPMLYLREQALSAFNGRELVVADRTYDRDTTDTTPEQPYSVEEDALLNPRTGVRQSVYLLTEHKLAFAVDFPVSITPLKNPNPSRFRGAFQAYSMAPAFALTDIAHDQVGDPRWPGWMMDHYLKKHIDPRYQALAETITRDARTPVEKIQKIQSYLSDQSTYTLTPNHEVKSDEDPVAPFLFGDMRGYCVHFAHAGVYLMRAVGIPARIGTGYLTDLSQAKDGHALLRMSDRHAWAEAFITGKGWLPFDVQPKNVESHGDTQVDMKLLEELMQQLEPPEEILPKQPSRSEPGLQPESSVWDHLLPGPSTATAIILTAILFPLILKGYLRYSFLLPGSPLRTLHRHHRATLSLLHDLGVRRAVGETRTEYRARIVKAFGVDVLRLTELLNRARYAPEGAGIRADEVVANARLERSALEIVPWWRRLIGFFNPASVVELVAGGRW